MIRKTEMANNSQTELYASKVWQAKKQYFAIVVSQANLQKAPVRLSPFVICQWLQNRIMLQKFDWLKNDILPLLLAKLTYKRPLSVHHLLLKKILSRHLLLNGWMDYAEIFWEFSLMWLVVHKGVARGRGRWGSCPTLACHCPTLAGAVKTQNWQKKEENNRKKW